MKQKYILYILFSLCISVNSLAQEKKNTTQKQDTIEGLQIYPNPVTSGRVYIITDHNSTPKDVEIYDMLGKKVHEASLSNNTKEININHLSPGVYMIKVKENNI